MSVVEFRIINDMQMPPIVITMNDDDEVKVVLNTYHRLWLSLNRKLIGGSAEALFEKIDMILSGYLEEQFHFEKEDRDFNEV
tara:strand:+ start:590 stop:835 length:246 start_codon:yes stop_codon:yes gene_type:complete